MKISVVIPCFRCADSIGTVVQELHSVLASRDYEIILASDGMIPEDVPALQSCLADNVRVWGISKSVGQHAITRKAAALAVGDMVVSMDDDGQHDPNAIISMCALIEKGTADLVYARLTHRHEPLWRQWIRPLKPSSKTAFRVWSKPLNERLTCVSQHGLLDAQLATLQPRIRYVEIRERASLLSGSRYDTGSYLYYIMKILHLS